MSLAINKEAQPKEDCLNHHSFKAVFLHCSLDCLTLTVLVATIDALRHFET